MIFLVEESPGARSNFDFCEKFQENQKTTCIGNSFWYNILACARSARQFCIVLK